MGATVYLDKISTTTQPDFGEWISSAHLVLTREDRGSCRVRERSTPEPAHRRAPSSIVRRNFTPSSHIDCRGTSSAGSRIFASRASIPACGSRFWACPTSSGRPLGFAMTFQLRGIKGDTRNTRRGGTTQPRIDGFFFSDKRDVLRHLDADRSNTARCHCDGASHAGVGSAARHKRPRRRTWQWSFIKYARHPTQSGGGQTGSSRRTAVPGVEDAGCGSRSRARRPGGATSS